jgi:hypothetical protein
VCVYSTIVGCLQHYIHTVYIIQTKLLQYYYREIVNNRRSYVMFRDLEWITLDLLCLYSNDVPQDLEQSIRNSQPVAPVRSVCPLFCFFPSFFFSFFKECLYLRVYDNRVSSDLPAPSPSLCYLLTHAHNTLPTPTLLTITCTQVLWFLERLTWPTVSCCLTTSSRLTVCLPAQPSVCEAF